MTDHDGLHGVQAVPPGGIATARLVLRPPTDLDLREVFDLYADPRVWGPDPMTRHHRIAQTEQMIERWRGSWAGDGLGMWVARSAEEGDEGAFVGIGGCFLRYGVAWNLGFRLVPGRWGRGYAHEISVAAMAAAHRVRPELPLTAYVLAGNDRSQRAVERLDLRLVWRGPDAGNPDSSAIRLLYSDRPLSPAVLHALTER
ncbi:GNAT family N-acetyltransferase [Micromonospora sp. R77]|uniref:GNAT family N-acetyltransferase n=1 Tax=Micromonospora sp. R77 TaxID=2925836 RepID=UPI001F61440D|nr:GNAT family N-acetyltransferase [Micromonospora sp. R77]MCI4066209.1 GNAT family N-acetyltransferase [Micromonospora sp. R77]